MAALIRSGRVLLVQKWSAALIIMALGAAAAFNSVWAEDSITVGIFQNKPIVYYDDGPKGLFVDVLYDVAEKEHWTVDYVQCEFRDCLNLLKTNQLDLMSSLGESSERSKYFTYSKESIWTFWGTVYSNDLSINSILDLKDKKIAVRRKNKITIALKELLVRFNIAVEYVEFDNYESAFKAVYDKNVDAVAVNNTYAFSDQKNKARLHKTPIVFDPFSDTLKRLGLFIQVVKT